MSRRYSEQVEVRMGEPMTGPLEGAVGQFGTVPTAFIWRGRLHVVKAVLGHWTQRLPWWRVAWSEDVGTGMQSELEQDVWRVEASAGRLLGTGVYDLTRGEQWRLLRVAD